MITLLDIQKSISRKLNSKFSDHYIYVEEVKKGKKVPSFFINIMPVNTDNFATYKDKLVNIDIMYFGKNETNEENLNMTNSLESLFNMTLKIQDREITIQSLNFKTVDNILHCGFSLDFTDIEAEEKYDDIELGYTSETITTMQELEIEEV